MIKKIILLIFLVSYNLQGIPVRKNNIIMKIKEIPVRDFVRTDALTLPKELTIVKSFNYRLFYREYFIYDNMEVLKKEYNLQNSLSEVGYFYSDTKIYYINKNENDILIEILKALKTVNYEEFRIETMEFYFLERRRSYLSRSRDLLIGFDEKKAIPKMNITKKNERNEMKEYNFQTLFEIEVEHDNSRIKFFLGDNISAYDTETPKKLILWIKALREKTNRFVYINSTS